MSHSLMFCRQATLGRLVQYPSRLDPDLARELQKLALTDPECHCHSTYLSKTMCTLDFYEGKAMALYDDKAI